MRRAGIAGRIGGTALALWTLASPARSQQPSSVTVAGLGALTFPVTTASAPARQAFLRGTLLLHLFHYDEARTAFRQAQQLDAGFTMAWWGEAMAWNYGVWNEQFPDSARASLLRLGPSAAARVAKGRTSRERDYQATVETLYGLGTKPHRDTVYAAAADKLSKAYPDDDEAKLFHALALLGLNQGVRDIPTYGRALVLAQDVFKRHPDHPGASHYVIHASDDPAHASLGLDAARALAKSSPAADHGQHMTSHIFMALGMWDDLVAANEHATHTAPMAGMPTMSPSRSCGHYNEWLEYGYVAQGRIQLATQLLQKCRSTARIAADFASMWSHYIVDLEDWRSNQLDWTATFRDRDAEMSYHFVRGLAAAKRGELALADSERRFIARTADMLGDDAAHAKDHRLSPADQEILTRAMTLEAALRGTMRSVEGKADEALALLRQATTWEDKMAYAFGPPQIDKPSHELLGEELLRLKRWGEARDEFQRALRSTPLRPLALRGLARAYEGAGMPREAKATWRQLAVVWHAADASLPGLDEARQKGTP